MPGQKYIVTVSWIWDNDEYEETPSYDVQCADDNCQEMESFDFTNDTAMFDFMFNHHEAKHYGEES